ERTEAALRDGAAYAMRIEAGHVGATSDPRRIRRHREDDLFVEERDDRVEVARFPDAEVALEERVIDGRARVGRPARARPDALLERLAGAMERAVCGGD